MAPVDLLSSHIYTWHTSSLASNTTSLMHQCSSSSASKSAGPPYSVLASHTLQRYCQSFPKIVTSFSGTNNVFLFFLQITSFSVTNIVFSSKGIGGIRQKFTSAPDDYIVYDGTIFCFVYSVHVIYKLRTCLRASSCNFVVDG